MILLSPQCVNNQYITIPYEEIDNQHHLCTYAALCESAKTSSMNTCDQMKIFENLKVNLTEWVDYNTDSNVKMTSQ